jgi:hypothetical protein
VLFFFFFIAIVLFSTCLLYTSRVFGLRPFALKKFQLLIKIDYILFLLL